MNEYYTPTESMKYPTCLSKCNPYQMEYSRHTYEWVDENGFVWNITQVYNINGELIREEREMAVEYHQI